MKKELSDYILKHGLSALLKEVEGVCREQADQLKDRNPSLSARWYKAEVHLFQLAGRKFVKPL